MQYTCIRAIVVTILYLAVVLLPFLAHTLVFAIACCSKNPCILILLEEYFSPKLAYRPLFSGLIGTTGNMINVLCKKSF